MGYDVVEYVEKQVVQNIEREVPVYVQSGSVDNGLIGTVDNVYNFDGVNAGQSGFAVQNPIGGSNVANFGANGLTGYFPNGFNAGNVANGLTGYFANVLTPTAVSNAGIFQSGVANGSPVPGAYVSNAGFFQSGVANGLTPTAVSNAGIFQSGVANGLQFSVPQVGSVQQQLPVGFGR